MDYRAALGLVLLSLVLACEGPEGPVGPHGARGDQGEMGEPGEPGSDGTDGRNGEAGANGAIGASVAAPKDGGAGVGPSGDSGAVGVSFRSDCKWCAPYPGLRSCSPDSKKLQRCVSDGDGCGHWEAEETCSSKCGLKGGSAKDSLGNVETARWACIAADAPDCRTGVVCAEREQCDYGTGTCTASLSWASATATLKTAFDGVTHVFTPRRGSSYASCTGSAIGDYWNAASGRRCVVSVSYSEWTSSSAGAAYAGVPISGASAGAASIAATGPTVTPSCTIGLMADRFALVPSPSCGVTISAADLSPGGWVEGSFLSTAKVTGHGEAAGASSITITGSFRATIAQ